MVWAEPYELKNWEVLVLMTEVVKPDQDPVQVCVAPSGQLPALTSWGRCLTLVQLVFLGFCTPDWVTDLSLSSQGFTGLLWTPPKRAASCCIPLGKLERKNCRRKILKFLFSGKFPILNGKLVNILISVLNLLGSFLAVFALGSCLRIKVSWEAFWPSLYQTNAIDTLSSRILIFHYGKT